MNLIHRSDACNLWGSSDHLAQQLNERTLLCVSGFTLGLLGLLFSWILGLYHHQMVSNLFEHSRVCEDCGRSTIFTQGSCARCIQFVLHDDCRVPLVANHSSPSRIGSRVSSFQTPAWYLLWISLLCRLGEATTPGPVWNLGVCNPAGLPGKAHLLSQHDVDVWLISETHLSSQGFRSFKRDLRLENSCLNWCVPGQHVRPRQSTSDHGNWGGVAICSRHPTRALPQAFPVHAYATSRLVCGATCLGNFWISGVVLYGVPKGPTHPRARINTNSLLTAAIDRLQDIDGPKYLAGDFNHDLSDLSASQRLEALGMIEIQELFRCQSGVLPRPTCRGKTRRDFLFISHHLVPMFRGLVIDNLAWSDHASIVARFEGDNCDLVRFPWYVPSMFDWREAGDLKPADLLTFEAPRCCTAQYTALWHSFEQRFSDALQTKGKQLPNRTTGRGTTMETKTVRGTPVPPKLGRHGECQPRYFGCSYLHCHWFKQLRRLQSFVRVTDDSGDEPVPCHRREHRRLLWSAIRNAAGFAPNFPVWWKDQAQVGIEPFELPWEPPSKAVAQMIFEHFEWQTRQLETRLLRERKSRRNNKVGLGLAKLFASVKRDAPAAVDILLEPFCANVTDVCQEDCAIEVNPPCGWDPTAVIRCNGAPVRSTMITPDKLYLEDIDGISVGDCVSQTKCTGSLPDIFRAFREQWALRWGRHEGVPLSHWSRLLSFAKEHLRAVCVSPLHVTVPLLRATAKAKKSKAAVGLDGVRRCDILAMDSNQLASIVSLYSRAHSDGCWPRQVTQGSITSLAKRSDPRGVNDYRPITIFSLIYRLWSSMQSQYWLTQVDSTLDAGLCGNRGARRAADLWRLVLRAVEDGHTDDFGTCGVVFDLEKAFNMLPRAICLAFVKLLGMDQNTLQGWAGALGQMERRFLIRGSVSPPTFGSCGFPEGCGLSCLAMLALDQVWHLWVRCSLPLARPMSFVDNWEILASSPQQIQEAFDRTLEFTRALDLVVDQNKTFCWSTDRTMRQDLRGQGFVVKLDAGDLGAHLTYSKQVRNQSLIARFLGLSDFWIKLRQAEGTHSQKLMVIRQAAWPRAMHGVAATTVGRKHFHGLRVQALRALHLEKPGANAWLQMHLEQPGSDPQFFALEQTIRDFRDLSGGEVGIDAFTRCASNLHSFAPNSITSVLISRIHWLGWEVLPEAWVRDVYGTFSLLLASWAEVRLRLWWGWHRVVSQQVIHKAGFESFLCVDPGETANALCQFGPYDRGILTRLMNGTSTTNQHACHWSSDGKTECVFCNRPDSPMHRFWECEHHGDLRKALSPELLEAVVSLPQALSLHSWTLQSPFQTDWYEYLVSIPDEPAECVLSPNKDQIIDFFTDGSCLYQDQVQFRVASWAVCVASSVGEDFSPSTAVSAGPLPGLIQTSFRAETYALLQALRIVKSNRVRARIWTDCQGVVDRFFILIHGRHRLKVNSPNADLWMDIRELVGYPETSGIQVAKVDAHVDPLTCDDFADEWLARHNNEVDYAAKQANLNRPDEVWELWEKHAHEVVTRKAQATELRQFHLDVAKRVTEASRELSSADLKILPMRVGKIFPMLWEAPETLDTPHHRTKVTLGADFTTLLQHWWLNAINIDGGNLVWVSYVQLYLLFQLETRHAGLVRVGRGWSDHQNETCLMPESSPFRKRSRWFRMCMQQYFKDSDWKIGKATTRPNSAKLTLHLGCISIPVKPDKLASVEQWLCNKLQGRCISQGHALDALPCAW